MKLYHGRHEKQRFITNVKNEKEALKEISKYLDEHKIKSYYIRYWEQPKGVVNYDYGSHTKFFYLYKNERSKEDLNEETF